MKTVATEVQMSGSTKNNYSLERATCQFDRGLYFEVGFL